MCYDRKFVRLLLIVAIYVLGSLGATIRRFSDGVARFTDPIPKKDMIGAALQIWSLAIQLLPLGALNEALRAGIFAP